MTLDELKAAMEDLASRIDEPLARAIVATSKHPCYGQAFAVDVCHPRDVRHRPAAGVRVRVSLSAWLEPVLYKYTDDGAAQ